MLADWPLFFYVKSLRWYSDVCGKINFFSYATLNRY